MALGLQARHTVDKIELTAGLSVRQPTEAHRKPSAWAASDATCMPATHHYGESRDLADFRRRTQVQWQHVGVGKRVVAVPWQPGQPTPKEQALRVSCPRHI